MEYGKNNNKNLKKEQKNIFPFFPIFTVTLAGSNKKEKKGKIKKENLFISIFILHKRTWRNKIKDKVEELNRIFIKLISHYLISPSPSPFH